VCVPREKVVGVIGSLSSDCTLSVTSFCTNQNLPSISYSASSPDLDDSVNYPYFLRTVPSDEEQAIAMVAVSDFVFSQN
jgi:ABC-type branched-subunit amino acid transport system substrate-binding protein